MQHTITAIINKIIELLAPQPQPVLIPVRSNDQRPRR
jgi:hypothetical protein